MLRHRAVGWVAGVDKAVGYWLAAIGKRDWMIADS
jgi:hypothetical protein